LYTGQSGIYSTHLRTQGLFANKCRRTLTAISRGFDGEVFTSRMPFVSPKQQHQSTECPSSINIPTIVQYQLMIIVHISLTATQFIWISSHPYPKHPYKTGQNSLYPYSNLGYASSSYVNCHLKGFEQKFLYAGMPFP